MNKQAAQTMPELPVPWSDFWAKKGNWALSHDYAAFELALEWLQANAAALSQTAGVAPDEIEEVATSLDDDAAAMLDENEEDEQALNMQRAARILESLLAAAPAASGGEDAVGCTCGACPLPAGCKIGDCMHGLDNTPEESNPPAGASVSERAREAWEDFVGCHLGDDEGEASLQTSGLCRMAFDAGMRASSEPSIEGAIVALVGALQRGKGWMRDYADAIVRDAIDRRGLDEQALTQQRGDGEAVDRDAWAEALELPQGYTVEEFLPGGWHYAWTRADGERMVSGTTWNHPALAAIAAWQYAPATTPQPGAEALPKFAVGDRVTWTNKFGTSFPGTIEECWSGPVRYRVALDDGSIAGVAYESELESLLARGGK